MMPRSPRTLTLVLALFGAGLLAVCRPAAADLDEPRSREETLAWIDTLHVNRRIDDAVAFIQPRLAEARAASDSAYILPLTAKLGRLRVAFGRPQEGEPLLREAVGLAEALNDSLRLCDALRWLGFSVEQQGRSTEAVAHYQRMLDIARRQDDRKHIAWASVGLAFRALQEGRYEDSLAGFREAETLFADLADTSASLWVINGIGAVLQQSGDYAAATVAYGKAADLARQVGYFTVQALAQNNQGEMEYALGDPGVALEYFRQARRLQERVSQNQDAVSTGTNEATCLMHLGRLDEAADLLADLLVICEEGNFPTREANVQRVLAGVRRRQGRRHDAVAIYRDILARDDALLDLATRMGCLSGLAVTLAEMDSSATALQLLQEEGRRREGRLHGRIRIDFEISLADRLRETGQVAAALDRYRFAADAAADAGLRQHRLTALAGAGRCQRDRGRTTAATELLRTAAEVWEDTRKVPLDPEWREQRGAAGRLIYTQLATLMMKSRDHGALARAFDAVQPFKARTLAERIDAVDPAEVRPPMTLATLQDRVLRPGEVFLDAYLGPTESILFVVTPTTARAVSWPAEPPLAERLRLYRDLLATPPGPADGDRALDTVTEAGRNLRRDLLGPATDLLKDSRRVILAPDGALNLIPLADPEARLVWMRVPSATILGFLRSEAAAARASGHGVLAAAATTTPDGQPLPGAVREVQLLADEYLKVDRRLTALKPTDLLPFAILHLATHARIDDQRPWSSEIVLAPDGPGHRIRADRIAALDLSADLAVLSACETGSGRILSGEGVLGLSSAFLSAGVPTVVASLWPVSDRVTVDLMKIFYARLADGRDVATSLAAAQKAIRDHAATAHPFHWAGFVTVGEGAATVELESRRRSRLPILILAVVVLAVLLLWRRG